MASERLSKLQKFIITAAYRKTILREPLPRSVWKFEGARANKNEIMKIDKENKWEYLTNELYYSALFESDVLMNFYGLQTLNEVYGYKGGSNKEKTALRRSLATLYKRGYINKYWQWSIDAGDKTGTFQFCGRNTTLYEMSYQSRAIITLTNKGKEKAAQFLKVVY